jgi:lysylphosphatidylglycerol synthetase-like protein (DUF2156 family)
MHEGMEMQTMSSFVRWGQEETIRREVMEDEKLRKIMMELQDNAASWLGYENRQGTLLYNGRLMLPARPV